MDKDFEEVKERQNKRGADEVSPDITVTPKGENVPFKVLVNKRPSDMKQPSGQPLKLPASTNLRALSLKKCGKVNVSNLPGMRNLSKSIIVHHNRNANIIQSYGRYNDVMSHENFEQDYEDGEFDPKSVDAKKNAIVLKDLPYRNELESSYLSVKGQRNGGVHIKTPNTKKTAISGTETGITAATSGVHQYLASRQLFGSMAFGGENGPVLAMTVDDSESKTGASGQNALLSLLS